MTKILLIDDNKEILTANKDYLTEQGFDVTCAETGMKALTYLNEKQFDCIVLDVLLPDLNGFAICKAARVITTAPIIFLSCLDDDDDKVKGLMSGGDGYMTKPYSLMELAVRIQVVTKRREQKEMLQDGVYVDYDNKILNVLGKNVLLSDREFKIFMLFYKNPKVFYSKEALLKSIWHDKAEIGIVPVFIMKLRRKLEFAEGVIGRITNEYGAGYGLVKEG